MSDILYERAIERNERGELWAQAGKVALIFSLLLTIDVLKLGV